MKKEKYELYICMAAILIFVGIIMMNLLFGGKKQEIKADETRVEHVNGGTWYVTPEPVIEADNEQAYIENEKQSDNFKKIKECKWSKETQKKIKSICDKYNISFELCMAMAYEESSFKSYDTGDKGKAYGAWQIHPSVWREELRRWGYTWNDMYDIEKSCDVYCRIMKSHFQKSDDVYFAVMAWNGGGDYARQMLDSGNVSDYSKNIVKRAMKYERRNR